MHYLARCSLSELNTLWEWGDLSISESNLRPPLIWYVGSHESDQSTRKTEGSLTPRALANWSCLSDHAYMIWRSFYSNETVKCSWSDSPSSSGDVVHVFMSSFSETADAENTARITHASVCMCAVNETARLCHSLTKMQNMQYSYLKCFCGLIFIDTSP